MMKQHVLRQLKLKSDPKYIFYVAPTRQLLEQTYKRLCNRLTTKQQRRVHVAYADDTVHAGSVSVEKKLTNVFAGHGSDGHDKRPWKEGSILFITHKAFLEYMGNYKDICAETLVLFDESRKWAEVMDTVFLDDDAQQYFSTLFKTYPFKSGDKTYVTIQMLKAKPVPENQKVSKLQGKSAARAFKILDTMHTALLPGKDKVIRTEAFVFFSGKGDNRRMIRITLPSHPFLGFKDVYVLSANFESSQMHAFMKMEGTNVVDKSKWFMDKFSKEGYDKSLDGAVRRYENVVIVPLLGDSQPPSVSKYYSGGCILPRSEFLRFGNTLKEMGVSTAQLYQVARSIRTGSVSKFNRPIKKLLKSVKANMDMHDWLVKKAIKVVRYWVKKYPTEQKPILFVNHKFRDKYSTLNEFVHVNHAKAEGDNSFVKCNAVVFLPAINPIPQLAQLLNSKLSPYGYDADEDFVVDKAIQCIGRGNVRESKSNEKMLAIVPTLGLAARIHARYYSRSDLNESVFDELGQYQSWDFKTYSSLLAKSKRVSKGKKSTRTPEQRKEIQRIASKRNRARKSGKDSLVAEYTAQLEKLRRGEA
jgi:hypothetical protein